ncbi:DNA polymerase III, delta subunit [Mesomycoplasma neurolyticum]|uniref:DNA polymerase III, delta subunit n=2 Tax=Mesomycoplasma neurolyticum TaxID=2120 RepID=A0A449A599_9BACT|nr:DNA polymerase III, delta subunit [Mesomycoplasma neurolyticum]
MYFFYGDERFLINLEVKKVINNYFNYDLVKINDEIEINDFLSKIDNFSLFEKTEIFIISNLIFLQKNDDNKNKKIIEILQKNIQNKNKIFIFTFLLEKKEVLNKNNLLFNFLIKNSNFKEISKIKENEIEKYTKKIIESNKLKISNINFLKLVSKLPNNLDLIVNEIKKLSYFNNEEITELAIDNLVMDFASENDFAFIETFIKLDFQNLFNESQKKINSGVPRSLLLSQINSFLWIVNIVDIFKKKFSLDELSIKFGIKIFRLKKAELFLNKYSAKKARKLINSCFKIDEKLKKGQISDKLAFDLFFLNFLTN